MREREPRASKNADGNFPTRRGEVIPAAITPISIAAAMHACSGILFSAPVISDGGSRSIGFTPEQQQIANHHGTVAPSAD